MDPGGMPVMAVLQTHQAVWSSMWMRKTRKIKKMKTDDDPVWRKIESFRNPVAFELWKQCCHCRLLASSIDCRVHLLIDCAPLAWLEGKRLETTSVRTRFWCLWCLSCLDESRKERKTTLVVLFAIGVYSLNMGYTPMSKRDLHFQNLWCMIFDHVFSW